MIGSETDAGPRIKGWSFVLAVPDVQRTARWWVDIMGFERLFEPDGWVFVRRDGCTLMLGECPEAIPPAELGDHGYFGYFEVDDVDAFYARLLELGADVMFPPASKPWGMREMGVRTPDGHRLMVGQAVDRG